MRVLFARIVIRSNRDSGSKTVIQRARCTTLCTAELSKKHREAQDNFYLVDDESDKASVRAYYRFFNQYPVENEDKDFEWPEERQRQENRKTRAARRVPKNPQH